MTDEGSDNMETYNVHEELQRSRGIIYSDEHVKTRV